MTRVEYFFSTPYRYFSDYVPLQNVELSALFGLLVFARFPDVSMKNNIVCVVWLPKWHAAVCASRDTCLVLIRVGYFQVVRTGSVAEMKDLSGEKQRVVVLKNFPDKGSVTVMDVKSRKKKTVTKLSSISCKRRNIHSQSC